MNRIPVNTSTRQIGAVASDHQVLAEALTEP
jgi:hypothetical protein